MSPAAMSPSHGNVRLLYRSHGAAYNGTPDLDGILDTYVPSVRLPVRRSGPARPRLNARVAQASKYMIVARVV